MPASASRSVYLIERYWLPRTPFCLSSGDAGLVDLLLAARDDVEDLTSDVAFERADGIELGMPLGDAPCHIRLRLRVGSQTNDCNDVQGAVGRSVAAPASADAGSSCRRRPGSGSHRRVRQSLLRI